MRSITNGFWTLKVVSEYSLFGFEGSNPFNYIQYTNWGLCEFGGIAQLGEHLPCKQGVRSSNLLISTRSTVKLIMHLEN